MHPGQTRAMKNPPTHAPSRASGPARPGRARRRPGRDVAFGVERLEGRTVPSHLLVTALSGSTSYDVVTTYLAGTPGQFIQNNSNTGGLIAWGDYLYDGSSAANATVSSGATNNSQLGDTIPGNFFAADGFVLGAYCIAQTDSDPKYAPWTATVTASATATATLEILPDAGQKIGDPVVINLSDPAMDTGATVSLTAGPAFNHGGPSGTLTYSGEDGSFPAKIGDTIPITITTSVSLSGASQDKPSTVTGEEDLRLSVYDPPPASTPVASITHPDGWDPQDGTVEFGYVNSGTLPQPPRITFAWASGPTQGDVLAAIPGSITGQTGPSTAAHPWPASIAGSSLTTPPAGTRDLLIEDRVGDVTNVYAVPYRPSLKVTDRYGATAGEKVGVFGRFFSKVPGAAESFTVTLSPDLDVLDTSGPSSMGGAGPVKRAQHLVVNLNGHVLTVAPTATAGAYLSQSFNPGALTGPTPLTVTDARGGLGLPPVKDAVDVVPEPKWFAALSPLEAVFNSATRTYAFSGSLVDVKTGTLPGFTLPAEPGLWLVSGLVGGPGSNVLDNGVDAYMKVDIVAPLNPTRSPTTETLKSGASVTFLGQPAGPALPETTTRLDLNAHTLDPGKVTYTYKPAEQEGKAPVSLFEGRTFKQPPLELSSHLTATVKYGVTLTVAFKPSGGLDVPRIALDFSVDAGLGGNLGIDGFAALQSTALNDALGKFETAIKTATKAHPVTALISELAGDLVDYLQKKGILPTLSGSAAVTGTVMLAGKVELPGPPSSAQPLHGSLTGTITLGAPTAALKYSLGKRPPTPLATANLGSLLSLTGVKINKPF